MLRDLRLLLSISLSLAFLGAVPSTSLASDDTTLIGQKRPLQLMRITPNGENTSEKRQIVFTFNKPVVPLGDMARQSADIPVEITPKLDCQWRWLNRAALACQLSQATAMSAATKYTIIVDQSFSDSDGTSLAHDVEHTFITERPKLRYARINDWENAQKPVIRLEFNQYVTKESVAKSVFFDTAQHRPAKENDIRTVDVQPDMHDSLAPKWVQGDSHSEAYKLADFVKIRKKSDAEKTQKFEARKTWLVKPTDDLQKDSQYNLQVGAGLVSASGGEPSVRKRKALNFATFADFAFLGVTCSDMNNKQLMIDADDNAGAEKCNPMRPTALRFTTPVKPSQIKKHLTFKPSLSGGRKDFDPWANIYESELKRFKHKKGDAYTIWLPVGLQAAQAYHLTAAAPQNDWQDQIKTWWDGGSKNVLKDVFGHGLKTKIETTFFTDHRPPYYKFLHETAVLESGVPSDIPLYVTNIDDAELTYRKMTADGVVKDAVHNVDSLQQVEDIQYATQLGIGDIFAGETGILYGHLETTPYVKKYGHGDRILNIVSPFQIHAKIGHFNSQIWVTDLATGDVVPNAKVDIYTSRLSHLLPEGDMLAQSQTNNMGIADVKGRIDLDPELDMLRWCSENDQDDCQRLFIRVTQQGRMAVMPLIYDFKLNTYRLSKYQVYPQERRRYGHMHAWGMTAQGIYRRGDMMDFKIYLRDQDINGYVTPIKSGYSVDITDPMGKNVWHQDNVVLSAFGTFSGQFNISKHAAVGWYNVNITHPKYPDNQEMRAMRVLVSDFTPSPFKVENRLNGTVFKNKAEIRVESDAKLHSGGPYSQAGSRVQAWLEKRSFISTHAEAKGFYFGDMGANRQQVFQKQDQTNAQGQVEHIFELPETKILYGRLSVESAIRDDRGKYIASQASATYVGRDRFVGLKQTKWLHEAGEKAGVQYLVTDDQGMPVAAHDVTMTFQYLENKVAKVKGAGNAYLSKYTVEWVDVDTCQGQSADIAALCHFTPEKPGRYKAIAKIIDTKGRSQQSESQLWVTGKGYVTWQQPNDHSLEIIPEQKNYKIGDTARYLVKNPYPDAHAWISIERYGILTSYSQKLEGSTPVISFEITEDMVPGFYLSISVTEPRIGNDIPDMGQIDLAKPVFKTGYIKQDVIDVSKKLDVTIDTAQKIYKPRDIVHGRVKISHKTRKMDQENPVNIALIVLDEAVLDLVQGGEQHFDPYTGFYKLDGLDVQNFNLLTRLIGLQKFDKKGANPGGDGGADLQEMQMRNLFKYVAHWQPNLPVNEDGTADFTFTLPDNLTGWRILAIAVDKDDLMGLGQGQFKTNKATEIRPAMPNQVQEGDTFSAAFTILNRSDQTRDIAVTVKATGDVAEDMAKTETYQIAPYQRQKMTMQVQAAKLPWQRDIKNGRIKFDITAKDAIDADMTMHHLNVYKNRMADVAVIYGASIAGDDRSEDLKFPDNIYPDHGHVALRFSPSVIGNIAGAFEYMRDYPYPCWEQKLSRAAMAGFYQKLKPYLPNDLTWTEADILPQDILDQAQNYQAPNGGMAYFVANNSYVSPYLSAYTALAFNWLRATGHVVPKDVEAKLHAYLKKYLRKAPDETYLGRASTVRAVILAALSEHKGQVRSREIRRYAAHMPQMSLFGKAHFLQAALNVNNTTKNVTATFENILKYSHQSSGKYAFQENVDSGYESLLTSNLRTNCAILSSMVKLDRKGKPSKEAADIAMKLTRMITQSRGNKDHFENTQENIFCLRGLLDYTQKYEMIEPNMSITGDLKLANNDVVQEMGQVTLSDFKIEPAPMIQNIGTEHVGQKAKLTITSEGQGRYYYAAEMAYAQMDEHAKPVNSGMDMRQEYSVETPNGWALLSADDTVRTGDLIRVDLYLSLPTARHFVVVDDHVPGGVEPVNRDLATTSKIDADKGAFKAAEGSWYFEYDDWRYGGYQGGHFYHQELRHDAARFYADYLPAGNYHLSYMVQAIAAGAFKKLPVKAAEMYDADIYGMGMPRMLKIIDAP